MIHSFASTPYNTMVTPNDQHLRRHRRRCAPLPSESSEMFSEESTSGGHHHHHHHHHPRSAPSSRLSPPVISLLLSLLLVALSCPRPASAQTYGAPHGGCKTFNLTATADSTLIIQHFSTYFDTTECLRATVSTYDDFTGLWSTMCQADVRGGGGTNITLIPKSACIPHTLLPGETGIFRMEYASCSENCTSACNCGPTMELPLGRLDEHYLYLDQICDADGTCIEDPIVDVVGLGYPLFGNWNSSFPSAMPSAMPSQAATIIGVGNALNETEAPSAAPSQAATIIGVGNALNETEAPSAAPSESAMVVGIGRLLGSNTSYPSLVPSLQPSRAPVMI